MYRKSYKKGRRLNTRKKYNRRTTRKYNTKLPSNRTVSRSNIICRGPYGTPMPQVFETSMTYNMTYSLTSSAAGVYQDATFRMNSVYDPDQTYTGQVATGYAIMTAVYTNYQVIWSKIKLQFINQGDKPTIVTLLPAVAANLGSNLTNVKSIPGYRSCTLEAAGSGGSIKTLTGFCWPHKLLRLSFEDDALRGNVGDNPTTQAFWVFGFVDAGHTAVASVTMNIEIEYRTRWTGRKLIEV